MPCWKHGTSMLPLHLPVNYLHRFESTFFGQIDENIKGLVEKLWIAPDEDSVLTVATFKILQTRLASNLLHLCLIVNLVAV